jgi:hypothetical protein
VRMSLYVPCKPWFTLEELASNKTPQTEDSHTFAHAPL